MNILNFKEKRKNNIKQLYFSKNGQSTIEFILLIPFLIITCFAVFQLGYVIYLQNNIKQLSREVARVITTSNSNMLGEEIVKKNNDLYERLNFDINIEPTLETSRKVGDILKVKVSINYDGFGDLIIKLFGKPLLIYSQTSMRMECE
ncbi:MAG: pilus assembly protein [Actinobacteria bacterium]|nr:pilus assembly protein [Actinomycetota bacterium]